MRFFEAIDWLKKDAAKTGFTVNGYDIADNKFHVWTGPDLVKAKKIAQDAKFSGRYLRTEIIDPSGRPLPFAGGVMPR